ncbi:hypothetical protein EZS27_021421 [termite gut metagenome]|uniref:Uncharacterized protein n=1 Tax=termite gut metagenome TaxID=433724 RepID=A0A5J4R7X8_9ZZZZ
MNRIELLKELLIDFVFEENACTNFFFVRRCFFSYEGQKRYGN